MKNEYLAHHGILGQKWGIRRFQNKDGSLTSEGKKRYSKGGEREPTHEELMRSTNAAQLYKYRDRLDDRELQNRLNRLNMEQQLKNLSKNDISSGEKIAKEIMTSTGKELAKDVTKKLVGTGVGLGVLAVMTKFGASGSALSFIKKLFKL